MPTRPLAPPLLLALALAVVGCQTTPPPAPRATGPFDWTLGVWEGVRVDGADASEAPMTMRVTPILAGAGQIHELEVRHGRNVYRGFAVQVFDAELDRWVRQYINDTRGRFTRIEGTVDGPGSDWRVIAPDRPRQSRLRSERLAPDEWRRTMWVSEDSGATWRVLWRDELRRPPLP